MNVGKYEIEDIGVDHSQYFQGRGVAYTDWDAVFVGVGSCKHDAIEDAIEMACQSGCEFSRRPANRGGTRIPREIREQPEEGELYYHVALYVRERKKQGA